MDQLLSQAVHDIQDIETALHQFPDVEYGGVWNEKREEWRRFWLSEYRVTTYQRLSPENNESLSVHEMAWICWAGCYLLTHVEGRTKQWSKEEALRTHARVRMAIREFNDFGRDYVEEMESLEAECASIIWYGPETEPDDSKQGAGTFLDEEKALFVIKADHHIDFETPFYDHRLPNNKHCHQFYQPKRWSSALFVVDCSRLFFWASKCAMLLLSSLVNKQAPMDAWLIQQADILLKERASLMTTTVTNRLAACLYYELQMPLGCIHAYNRVTSIPIDAFAAISRDCGDKHIRALTEQMVSKPEEALNRGIGPVRDAWIWTLWDRLLHTCEVEWLKDYMCLPHQLCEKHKADLLSDKRRWNVHVRRPMVIFMFGSYWVQSVHEDHHELWCCDHAVHAIVTWCVLMSTIHKGLTIEGFSVLPVINRILKPR
jgi:hypothetical protein